MITVTVSAGMDGYLWTVKAKGWEESGYAESLRGAFRRARRASNRILDLPKRAGL